MVTQTNRVLLLAGLISLSSLSSASETQLNGLLEVEGGLAIDSQQHGSSDISLATLELGISHHLSNQIAANVVILHEDYDTEPAEIDQANLTVDTNNALQFILGRQYIPFGTFDSAMISDPLTLEIGETREAAIGVITPVQNVSLQAFVFKGDVTTNWQPNWLARLSFEKQGAVHVSLDTYYINELGNSENMTAALGNASSLAHSVPGAGAAMHLSAKDYHFKAECLGAIRKFSADELNSNQPVACHYELSTSVNAFRKETLIAASYGLTRQAADLELPRSRLGASISFQLNQNTALSTEWTLENSYIESSNNQSLSNNFVTQLAYNF